VPPPPPPLSLSHQLKKKQISCTQKAQFLRNLLALVQGYLHAPATLTQRKCSRYALNTSWFVGIETVLAVMFRFHVSARNIQNTSLKYYG
jgi:hypothetical protein